jgi:ATP-dependent protease ClpP protease subunit
MDKRWMRSARPVAALRAGRTDWYRIRNATGGRPAQVMIYDEIGFFGVSAADFAAELAEIDVAEIDLHLSSPGGEIFDGITIMNALRAHRAKVTTYVDALAASIASVIAMAGDRIVMRPHSQMMIHDGAGVCVGNAADMRELADLLDRQSDNIAEVYAARAGGTRLQWRKRMQAETWYSAKEAVEAGLADEVTDPEREEDPGEAVPDMAASWDLSIFRHAGREKAPAPELVARATAPPPVPERAPEPPAEATLEAWDPSVFRDAVRQVADPFAYEPGMFRDAVTAAASNAPAPPHIPVPPAEEPDPYDPTVVTRALKEAIKR